MKLSAKTGKTVVGNVIVDENQDLMALTSIGKMIRVDMQTIRKAGRNTSGVNIVDVDKGDRVVSIAKCPKEKEDELDISNIEDFITSDTTTTPVVRENTNILDTDGDNDIEDNGDNE